MMKFRCYVEITEGGYVEIVAPNRDRAWSILRNKTLGEIRDEVEDRGQCGDRWEPFWDDMEIVHEPSVSDTLWS